MPSPYGYGNSSFKKKLKAMRSSSKEKDTEVDMPLIPPASKEPAKEPAKETITEIESSEDTVDLSLDTSTSAEWIREKFNCCSGKGEEGTKEGAFSAS